MQRTTQTILDPIGTLNSYLQAIISGWGTLQSGGSQPDILQEVCAPNHVDTLWQKISFT